RPGRLLQLQAPEFDVQLVARVLQPGQLDEQLPVLVARVDHADGRHHAGQDDHAEQDAGHGAALPSSPETGGRGPGTGPTRSAGSSAGRRPPAGGPSCSATRSPALRARGLAPVSAAPARIAPPTSRSAGTNASAAGSRRLPAGALAWRATKRLTIRSSSE